MNNQDRIELFDDSLLIHFVVTGTTNSISLVKLNNGAAFGRDGTMIRVHTPGLAGATIIETFATEALTTLAFHHLLAAMRRYARTRRIKRLGSGIALWIGAPLLVLLLLSILNLAITRAPTSDIQHPLTAGPATTLNAPENAARVPALPAAPASADLARAMADGAKTGKFSIQLSSGTKGTLYVFSDPSCMHCRRIEPELDQLAKEFTIHIFPVSAIGGNVSRARISKLMCSNVEKRAARWKAIVDGQEINGLDCSSGHMAVDGNNQVFASMRFSGTPTIINGAGALFPDELPNTADAIGKWMQQNGVGPQR
ncbi:MAG: DsbC family protein [Pseudomonadota bacterium]